MSKKSPVKQQISKRRKIEGAQVYFCVQIHSNQTLASPLHRFIYTSKTSFLVAFILAISFFIQGVSIVFANESDTTLIPTESSVSEESALENTTKTGNSTIINELASEEVFDGEEEVITDSFPTLNEAGIATNTTQNTDNNPDVSATSTDNSNFYSSSTTADTDETSSSSDSANLSDETSTTTEEVSSTTEEFGDATSSLDSETDGDDLNTDNSLSAETISSSTIEGPAITTPISVNYSDSGFTFNKNECTELASGSFYCVEPQHNTLNDALFASADSDGDLEIYLVRNGNQVQITNNQVDDAAPFFDQNSETIVWHRLIDDRYQIISYDISSGTETQLTFGTTNNMEPMRQGKYTVWQRWTDNNWDIILSDGNNEEQITHTSAHDIAPYIHGSLIVWNRYTTTGEKTIEMFDISSKTYVTVDDPAGFSVTNPRMVLVYDQMHPNGDVITKGYDLIEKRFIQLDTLPRQLPLDIPKSEPTDETRAMIQSKPTIKGDEIENGNLNPNSDPVITPLVPDIASSSSELILDLSDTTEKSASSSDNSISQFDLIVESTSSST